MADQHALQYPMPTAIDRGLTGLRALVGCAAIVTGPAGSLLQIGADQMLPSPVERRREAFFQALADGIHELKDRKQLDTAEVIGDEQFVSAVIEASEIAVRNHSRIKLDALRNAVLNCALAKADDESKRRTFMRFVDELSEGHILLLELFQGPPQWFTKHGQAVPEYHISSSMGRLIGDAFPQLAGHQDFLGFMITDLNNRRLCDVEKSNLNTMMSPGGAFTKRTTAFGDEFLRFVSQPV